jgi:hypothetical protein
MKKSQSLNFMDIDSPGYDSDNLAAPYTVVTCQYIETISICVFVDMRLSKSPDGTYYMR